MTLKPLESLHHEIIFYVFPPKSYALTKSLGKICIKKSMWQYFKSNYAYKLQVIDILFHLYYTYITNILFYLVYILHSGIKVKLLILPSKAMLACPTLS
jgi:hypothetical protein